VQRWQGIARIEAVIDWLKQYLKKGRRGAEPDQVMVRAQASKFILRMAASVKGWRMIPSPVKRKVKKLIP
jgi:hypothetical protein